MHTLIVAENAGGPNDINQMLDTGPPIRLPRGARRVRYTLQIWNGGTPEAALVAGPDSELGAVALASADRTKRRLLEFGAHCLTADRLNDEVGMQVIFIFHRSHRKNARALAKAIRMLGAGARWRSLSDLHHDRARWLHPQGRGGQRCR